jgi:FkbM family methyltransferase
MSFSPFNPIEIEFFNKIKEDISVVFDIGLRDDIDYLKNSFDKSREFHMFEPDSNFVLSCYKQLEELEAPDGIENEIYFNTFGLGEQEGELAYFPNTQSFVFRTVHTMSQDVGITFPIKTLDGYCKEKEIKNIDFLKVDIEGMEIDCFNGGKQILTNGTKIIQFEFASTMLDRKISPEDYIGWFDKNIFDLYLIRVSPEHPYYSLNDKLLTPLSEEVYQVIRQHMVEASGCNMVAVRKEYSEKVLLLSNS